MFCCKTRFCEFLLGKVVFEKLDFEVLGAKIEICVNNVTFLVKFHLVRVARYVETRP